MTNIRESLTQIIQNFAQNDLRSQSLTFFKTLGYASERRIEENGLPETFLENYDAQQRFNKERGLLAEWLKIYLLFQLTDNEIKPIKPEFHAMTQPVDNSIIESFLFIALELKQTRYSRTDLAKITRAINQIFMMPAILLFKHGETLTLSVIDRRLHQRDDSQDVLEKVTLIKDVAIVHPHRAHLDILQQLMLSDLQVSNFVELYKKWREVLDISVLNKQFYQELAVLFTQLVGGERNRNTYLTSLKLPSISDDRVLKEFAVRLIGRLLFCWFLQKKTSTAGISLIPSKILSSKSVKEHFYHETLEPLFFEVLNKELEQRKPAFQQGYWQQIPFLNGGLFEPHVHDFYDGNCTLNTLIVPADWLAKLLAFFERYHFTIEENTPLDVQVAIDPEMLGQIFENLLAEINPETGETARKATGSYYTPREIVDYMVDESLVAYFSNLLGSESVSHLRALLSYAQIENPLNVEESQKLLRAIETIKILDPACGSGAFPMGVLQKLTLMLQRLDPNCEQWLNNLLASIPDVMARRFMQEKLQGEKELWDYTRKLGILRECIYGVDIQPIAVEISRLRCFLALIVDEKVEEDKPNRGIIPLPNLAFKFVCANTLKGISQLDWQLYESQTRTGVNQLAQLRAAYLISQGKKKAQLQAEFMQVQKWLLETVLQWAGKDSEASQLATWQPFSDESCLWFDPFWMFGIKAGFDVVLGNPPYVRQEQIGEQKATLLQNFKDAATGKSDLYVYFYARGLQLLKQDGIECLICSNSWLDVGYGAKLQEFLLKNYSIMAIVHNETERQFETAAINTIISFIQNRKPSAETETRFITFKGSLEKSLADKTLQREIVRTREQLWRDGSDETSKKYEGDKWGGKYLRAPDIYWQILTKGRKYLCVLSSCCNIEGYIHDNNTGNQYSPTLFLKTIKSLKTVFVSSDTDGVVSFGVKETGNSRLTSPILFPRTFGDRHIIAYNPEGILAKEFYKIIPKNENAIISIVSQLNNTITILQRELIGLTNLGDGALKFSIGDISKILILNKLNPLDFEEKFYVFSKREIKRNITDELKQPDRRALDDIVFDMLDLTTGERDAVYEAVVQLVEKRLKKARSV